jgi:arylsulfatase A-like enzyme
MVAGAAIGAWAVRVNGDAALSMGWLALGRVLPLVSRAGAAGVIVSLALAGIVILARRIGRPTRLASSVLLLGLGAWGVSIALGSYRSTVFALERASTPRLTWIVILTVLGSWVLLVLARAADGLRAKGAPPATGRAASAARAVALLWLLASILHLAFPALGAMRAKGLPPVIVVSLDTLRADRLGFLGNKRGLTPHLDALAAEGVVFEKAIATAPWTLASHASLFTSKLPFDHRARLDFQKVGPRQVMLAESLREAGYRTGAFTADGYVAAAFGFDQGFEIYDESDDRKDDALTRTLGLALSWVRERKDTPYFMFLHTYEVHSPYTHPEKANQALKGRLSARFTNTEIEDIRHGRLTLTPDERRWVQELYDGDVAYMDRLMGGFFDTLRKERILDRAIVIVLSDHGDDLWDHSALRSPGHGHSLYQELIHVPLFVRWPAGVHAGTRVRGWVSLLDVAPTLLELVGLPPNPEHRGRSLADTWKTGVEPSALPATAESAEYGPDRFAVIEGRYKVIFTPWPEEKNMGVAVPAVPLEIFDLETDPSEQIDLSPRLAELPAEVLQMVARARERAVAKKPAASEGNDANATPSEELLERLRALGYVQ